MNSDLVLDLGPVSPGSGFGMWSGVLGVRCLGCRYDVASPVVCRPVGWSSGIPRRVLGPGFGGLDSGAYYSGAQVTLLATLATIGYSC